MADAAAVAAHGRGYARDLRWFWCFLAQRGLDWSRVGVQELGEFAAWLRQPAPNVIALGPDATARRAPATVNRMLSAVVGFYEHQARHGNDLARRLVDRTRSGRGPYRPFLHDLAPSGPRGRVVRLREPQHEPHAAQPARGIDSDAWRRGLPRTQAGLLELDELVAAWGSAEHFYRLTDRGHAARDLLQYARSRPA